MIHIANTPTSLTRNTQPIPTLLTRLTMPLPPINTLPTHITMTRIRHDLPTATLTERPGHPLVLTTEGQLQ
jgi:hypothetical protein